ncbi:uncharacterized protein LOC108864582 [Galendromus occidentalis]|uniref:Uncharacterized protein LOC108864582 n=1 Tax=Galendromus occidentalis TaxID=34638 RepID=A0AAJ7PA94_9ACAR|nr:uncharacterized protein LOC108864582 [Galendromus occidentalis]
MSFSRNTTFLVFASILAAVCAEEALVPLVDLVDITDLGISLRWDVILPLDPRDCHFLVEVCPDIHGLPCFTYDRLPHDTRTLLTEFKPFVLHNITVSTVCQYFDEQAIRATSEARTVFAAIHPSAPEVQLVEKLEESISIRWLAPGKPAGPIHGYELIIINSENEASSDNNWVDRPSTTLDWKFEDLDEDTAYVVKVRAYNINKNGKHLTSPGSTLKVKTGSRGKGYFWDGLLAVFGLTSACAVLYAIYIRYRRHRGNWNHYESRTNALFQARDGIEIEMGEEPYVC